MKVLKDMVVILFDDGDLEEVMFMNYFVRKFFIWRGEVS